MNITRPFPTSLIQSLLTAWGYIQRELLYIMWSIMDVALVTPISLALMSWAIFWPPGEVLLWLLLLILLPFNLVRLMSLLELPRPTQQNIMAVALLLTEIITIRTLLYSPDSLLDMRWVRQFFANLGEAGNLNWLRDLAVFLLVVLMWMRGIRLATRTFELNRAGLRLRVGGLIIAPLVVWLGSLRLPWSVAPFLLLFFLAGVTCVALVRAEQIEQERSGKSASLSPRWLGVIFLAGILTVFTAGALAVIVSGETAVAVVGTLAPLWTALNFGSTVVIATLAFLLLPLLNLLGIFMQWLATLLTPVVALWQSITPLPTPEPLDITLTPQVAEQVARTQTGNKLIIILLLVAVVLLVTLGLARLYRQATFAARESLPASQRLQRQRTEKESLGQRLLRRFGLWNNWRAAASIRRVYQQMLNAAESVGYPRAESETPYEFLKTLAKIWPEHQNETQLITQAYVRVRYGELPETQEELDAILQAWQVLEQTPPATTDIITPHNPTLQQEIK
ncbi:MAG: DUF4129 domain-containing protein [Chloroflexi bacterium]|nr:MAG: DUF4129 domain-containing protein [Chloroflexota bacterium]